jgi:metal-responsive CopG/Arc/MetJ family transcriptional regulator
MESIGISLPPDLLAEINEQCPDEMSRSEYMRQLLSDGLVVDEYMEDQLDREWSSAGDRRGEIRQALKDWVKRDRDGEL